MSYHTRWMKGVAARIRSILHPRAAEARMDEEFRFHLEMETAKYIREGLAPDAARRAAMLAFGGVERHKEEMRDERGRRWADDFWMDVRFGVRQLRRSPGFTTVILVTLALGIGATTAIFSVVNGVILEPLPFGHPAQLVHIESTDPDGRPTGLSPLDFIDYRDQSHSFAGMVPVDGGHNASITRPGLPAVRIGLTRVGAQFFTLLEVQPEVGRFFTTGEDVQGAPKVAVLSDVAWRRYFAADRSVVGRTISLDGEPYTVVGIAGPTVAFPAKTDVWIPKVWQPWEIAPDNRAGHVIMALGRIKDGISFEQAQRELETIADRLAAQYPKSNEKTGAVVQPLQEHVVGDVRPALFAMLGAVGFVLLIVCANVANLLLVRATSRESEIAVRTALGAARSRLVRQLATENVLLAVGGTVLGVLVAWWAVRAVVVFGPPTLPRLSEITMDARVLFFAASLALVAGLSFGLAPALRVMRTDISRTLHRGVRGSSRGGTGGTRAALVVTEMALAVVLLVGAGLLVHSFARLIHVDPGFHAERLVAFNATLPNTKYLHDRDTRAFVDKVVKQLQQLPGTERVAIGSTRPLDPAPGFGVTTAFTISGRPAVPNYQRPETAVYPVSPDYFRTLGIRLIRGRTFTEDEDRPDARPVVIVNEELVRRYFPNEDPIGKYIVLGIEHTTGSGPGDTLRAQGTIIGVVGDVKQYSLADTPAPATYVPYGTLPFGLSVVVRTTSEPETVESAILARMRQLDPDVPVFGLGTVESRLSSSVSQPRFYMILLAAFAALALVLAAVGIYGVLSYAVSQRTRELGIRMALGASAAQVTRQVLRQGLGLAVIGIIVGLAGALALTRVIASLLFGVQPLDPLTFVGVSVTLVIAALAACYLPARRAGRADPLTAMRVE